MQLYVRGLKAATVDSNNCFVIEVFILLFLFILMFKEYMQEVPISEMHVTFQGSMLAGHKNAFIHEPYLLRALINT